MWNPINRRQMLVGSAKFGLVLPALSSLAPALQGQNAKRQKNFICFFKPNGCYPEDYFAYDLYKDEGSLGVRNLGNGHRELDLSRLNGAVSKVFADEWTALKPLMNLYWGLSPAAKNHNGFIPFATDPTVPSIDQIVAQSPEYNRNGHQVRSIQTTKVGYDSATSFQIDQGAVKGVRATKDALVLFQLLFQDLAVSPDSKPGDDSRMRQILLERKAMDTVLEDYKRLLRNPKLSNADRMILSNYIDFVNDQQKRLADSLASERNGTGGAPVKGAIPNQPDPGVNDKPLQLVDTMINLMVAAIKVNACNTFNVQLAASVDETNFPLSVAGYTPGSFHSEISHNQSRQSAHTAIDQYLFGQVAKTFKALQTNTDSASDETYADNTLIYVGGDMGAGHFPYFHESFNSIAVTLSGKNMGIKSGRALAYAPIKPYGNENTDRQGYPVNQLLIALMEATGADWRQVLKRHNLLNSAGFGVYGGPQLALTDTQKMQALPHVMG